MSDFTFLTEEQIFGSNQIDIMRKRGIKAVISDFAALVGGWISDYHVDSDSSLNGRTGFYLTKSYEGNNEVRVVLAFGETDSINMDARPYGVRPVLPFTSIDNIPTNGREYWNVINDVLEIEYGYYPQRAVSRNMQNELEKAYKNSSVSKTGNSYTTDSIAYKDFATAFKPKIHEEYEYNGKRYVRVEAKSSYEGDNFTLSNGEKYCNGNNVWVEVEPVKWLVDEKERIMITEKLIVAGVQFNKKGEEYTGNFDESDIKKFMDRYLARDLVQPRGIEQQIQTSVTRKNKNLYNLEFDEVSELDIIRGAIESNVSIFLHGKPGCGKSDRVKQLDPDFIELNLSHLDPELLDGIAGEKNGKAVHIKPPWLEELETKCKEEPDKIHILFLEEITNASQMMQSKAYGIALDKKVAGRWKLPENVRVVAAGNELEDSLVANEMAEPLYDRFAHVNIETTVEGWLEWAVTPESFYERLDYKKQEETRQKIHPAIYAFIAYKGDEVLRTPYNRENPQPHADPRRWKMASDMLYASNNPNTIRAIVGEDLTREFISFCMMPTITIQDVIKENYTEQDLEMDLGRQLATVSGLVRVDDKNMPKVREFVKKLGSEMCKKFEVQWAGGDEERLEQLQELRLMEKEEAEKKTIGRHTAGEARGTSEAGILAYNKINGSYEKYLVREETKGDELKDK